MKKRLALLLLCLTGLYLAWPSAPMLKEPAAPPTDWQPRGSLEGAAIELCRTQSNCFMAVISTYGYPWRGEIRALLNKSGRVIYEKPLYLTGNAPRNLILSMYGSLCDKPHKWINDECAVNRHLKARFGTKKNNNPTYAVLFECPSKADAIAWKRYIRKQLNIGTTALHVTDSSQETLRLAELFFDDTALASLARKPRA